MNNAIFNRKFTKRNENHNIIKCSSVSNQSNNSLQNLLIVIDKYKYLISKSNSMNSMLINSSTSSVINSINHILSEFGEESIRRNTNRHSDNNTIKPETDNRITEISTKNETWMKIVKEFQEIIVNHANINLELLTLILTTISQIHERQSLRVSDGTVLEDICSRLIDNLDNCDARIRALYLRCVASFILGNLGIIAKELFTNFSGAFFKESEKYLKAAREREFNGAFFSATEKYSMAAREAEFECVECLKYCISGLTNLSYVSSNEIGEDFLAKRFQICGRFLQIFVDCLEISPCFVELSAISRFRMQHQCLHGLNYVSQRPHGLSVDNIERLLDVVRRYCGCGLGRMCGRSVTETGLTETDETSMFAGGVSTDDLGFQRGLSTDDFCFHSNNNNTATRRPMKKWETKTRKLALELLLRIVEKSWKKVSPRIWMGFMPFGGDCCGGVGGFDLVELLETEIDCHTRLLAVQAIEMCVSSCKEFLVTAQQPAGPTRTFVSHSQNLAVGLMRLHGRLLHWMVADPAPVVRLRLIRCVCVLVRNAPYHRLRPGLVGDVVWQLRALFLDSSRDDTAVRCAILDCFSALVGLESVSQETRRWLIDPPRVYSGDSHVHSHLVQSTGQNSHQRCGPDQTSESPSMSSTTVVLSVESHNRRPSWLVQLCVRVAHPALVEQLWAGALSPESWERAIDPLVDKVVAEGSQQPDTELRCRALRTLSAMLPQHCSIIGPSIDTVKRTLLACLDESIQYQAALRSDVLRVFSGLLGTLDNKKVKRYLGIMQDCQTGGNENNQTGDNCVGTESELSSGISYFSSSSSAINGVSNISSNIDLVCDWWNSFLPSVVQCLQDDNESVRRSAAQCLCFMCEPVLEHMMERTAITSHWQLLLTMFRDPSSSVSCQAIWSLGYWVALRPLNSDADFIRALIGTSSRLCNTALADSSLYLECANAAWTLSNAIEVLVAHKECLLSCCQQQEKLETSIGCAAIVMEYLTDVDCVARLMQLFCDLCGVKKAGQVSASARIHENAIRGLGYLCRFIDENMIFHLSTSGLLNLASETFSKAVQLSDKAGRVKVKWNACLSVSHVYHNRFLISKNDVFNLHKLNAALVSTVTGDRYFKVRNNSLVSINTLIDCGGRSAFGEHLFDMIIGPLAETCLSVIHKTTIPFSEVHRHCLCLYLLNFTLLKLVNLISQSDLDLLATRSDLLSLLFTVFSEQLPSIWRHLRNLNRSFNKQALLTQTLMLKLSVSATYEEVDLLLSNLRMNLDVNWVSTDSSKLAIDLLEQLYRSVSGARICDDEIIRQDENALNFCDSMSDDEGLMTKRPGTALIFSQIYD